MRASPPTWILFAAVAMTAGCSKKNLEPVATAPAPATAQAGQAKADEPVVAATPSDTMHGTRKLKGLDLPVYVDGVQKGVLRYGDLPGIANVGSDDAPQFRLADYLKGIGVAPASVKSVYVWDNSSRIGSVEGSELVKEQDRFRVRFSAGKTGGADVAWDTMGLKNLLVVHEIRKISVFVAKDAPKIARGKLCIVDEAGECSDATPYAAADAAKGTRVYIDGKLAGAVKRKLVSDTLAMGGITDNGESKLSLAKLAAELGADATGATTVELVSGDEVVGRADAAMWAKVSSDIFFTLGQHQHGKLVVRVPASMQSDGAVDRDALVTSVHVYKHTSAMSRELVAISDFTNLSAQLAANDDAPKNDDQEAKR
jgi:hypothetical protein